MGTKTMSQALQDDAAPLSVFGRARTDKVLPGRPELAPAVGGDAAAWSAVKSRFDEIGGFGENWDGRGSARVPSGTLAFARQMLTSVMPPKAPAPVITPLGDGGIQLVWRSPRGELEIEVTKPNQVIVFNLDSETGAEREWEESTDFTRVSDLLWNMFKT
jgi:hypothetical protein